MQPSSVFRHPDLARALLQPLEVLAAAGPPATFMEVCGTHTMAIFRHGIKGLLPPGVNLVSGPGCPVCVTSQGFIDQALEMAELPDAVLVTFGDMLHVPGSCGSLAVARAAGADVRYMYSPMEAVEIARTEADRQVILLGVGFETTAPLVAATVQAAAELDLTNFFLLGAHKLVPPALEVLARSPALQIHGFLCPGHVSSIIGSGAYAFIPERFGVPCVVAGFEPVDILQGLTMLLRQVRAGAATVENQYRRIVRLEGNAKAQAVLDEVFEPCDAEWRGLGMLPASGLALRPAYARFDAARQLGIPERATTPDSRCRCGEVLTGSVLPVDCRVFGTACTPERPLGPCMVSAEGTCAAYYRYGPVGAARAG